MDKTKRHEELCKKLHKIYEQKNEAYGDSFGRSVEEWGIAACAVRLSDKWHRFVRLSNHPEIDKGDEAITDTLLDLANYAIMTIMELELHHE